MADIETEEDKKREFEFYFGEDPGMFDSRTVFLLIIAMGMGFILTIIGLGLFISWLHDKIM